jgi:large subunit ribosomal protein L6
MSRVGKIPIPVPSGVKVSVSGRTVTATGPQGELKHALPGVLDAVVEGNLVRVTRSLESTEARSLHGLHARLLANVLRGVSAGYEKKLEIFGVGYRASMEGKDLVLLLGFSHPIKFPAPAGITLKVEEKGAVVVSGCDRQKVGETAARLRRFRPPEPYKGKGIRYQGEWIKRKVGKAVA